MEAATRDKEQGGRTRTKGTSGGTDETDGLSPSHPFSRFSAISLKAAAERTREEGRRAVGDLHRKIRNG